MPKILISPLDWGLGHTTRCVPIIRELIKQGNEVILGATAISEKIFAEEFPGLQRVIVPSYGIEYSAVLPAWAGILLDYRRLKRIVSEENELVEKITKDLKIDIVISDNRFGFRASHTKNIIITHQLWIKSPVMEKTANSLNHAYLKNFNEVWVPDTADEKNNLSGDLCHNRKFDFPVRYIGLLSRYHYMEPSGEKPFLFSFIISGPEPRRTSFEEEAIEYVNQYKGKFALVRGTTKQIAHKVKSISCEVFDLPTKAEMERIISNSRMVVSRSGYSTMMDLVIMKKPAFIMPTHGQTEQVYLGHHLDGKYGFKRIDHVEEIAIIPHTGLDDQHGFDTSGNDQKLTEAVASL
jgi:UDP-N-acetylglucosamine transferase subunit ALG13